MTAWVLAGARSQPFVLAFEDLHWADPTSLDLLRAFADRGAQAPLRRCWLRRRVLSSVRPGACALTDSLMSLSPLDRAGVAHMVGEISARHALSKELIEGVNERTGGVPLFVEEVTSGWWSVARKAACRPSRQTPAAVPCCAPRSARAGA